MALQQKN